MPPPVPFTSIEDVINNSEEATEPAHRQTDGRLATIGKKRTRTGCLNCRRKRRKCDEVKPTCETCQGRNEVCEWGVKVSFRPENAHTMAREHPSMKHAASHSRNQSYQIINITSEVIRDYFEETTNDIEEARLLDSSTSATTAQPTPRQHALTLNLSNHTPTHDLPFEPLEPITSIQSHHSAPLSLQPEAIDLHDELSGISQTPILTSPDLFLSPQYSDSQFDDGIFLPGSEFQELHAALRSKIIDTARSTAPSRMSSPDHHHPELQRSETSETADDEESRRLAHLSIDQEYVLLQNYINEVAPWLDKFDVHRHFELVLPMLAKRHSHLRYSILALSARQIELKARRRDHSCSLALYQHAIHLLSPLLQYRTTEILASCVVLCVLEMMSCSPKAWRRHLDGCAALIQALGISGGCGGLEQALFWCFARMDICGGLISSERTLIPLSNWMGRGNIIEDVNMLMNLHKSFDMYANHIVYLTAQVVDLLCSSGKWEQRHRNLAHRMDASEYLHQWTRLFELLDRWWDERPEEMKVLLHIPPPIMDETKPFPTLLYGNGPAVSGNQMYHTSALLMLKYKPSHVNFAAAAKKPRSILWHARQICAISISNDNHACWTNCVQPLWIAGQHMSHESEHRAILAILDRIEREIGWATRWRQDD
ncbi:uncharacterized protein MYCFIDRAFT_142135 [Pseudocercospora fijiensis CIRAD86]|uniref:Zn(2)-C6 fungal-type domain-containing protein n=1 Tax=Pseudocercospora fijiensis (strain CIRAD86) TaxID=383855 RepID=M2YPW0_PSEFD|nr:uncharacterized protein MYCFIDRAFT_142135 [Pseudocercospora fijiensis CIRAD86]EME79745.1 hypothetical protein MYCFIDRAFT_142135 [Pseudocercospora fijiensis CIRAD86]